MAGNTTPALEPLPLPALALVPAVNEDVMVIVAVGVVAVAVVVDGGGSFCCKSTGYLLWLSGDEDGWSGSTPSPCSCAA